MSKKQIARIALEVGAEVWPDSVRNVDDLEKFATLFLERVDAEHGRKAVAEVKSYEGSLNDLTIIVWTGAPIPIGTKLYATPQAAIPEGWALVPGAPTPKVLKAAQIKSELGAYACSNLSGGYDLITEMYIVMVAEAAKEPRHD